MKNTEIKKRDGIVLLIDVFCIIFSYLLSVYLLKGILDRHSISSLYGKALAIIALFYAVLYRLSESNMVNICKRGFYKEFLAVTKSNITLGLILLGYLFITKQGYEYSRFFLVTFFTINILFTFVMRSYFKLAMLLGYKKSTASNKLMIITLSQRAETVLQKMKNEYEWVAQVNAIAILDQDMVGDKIEGIEIRANRDNLLSVVKEFIVDEVFIDLPYEYQMNLENMILELEKMGIVVHININIYNNLKIQEKIIGNYFGFQVITFATQLFDQRKIIIKRLIDILGGVVGLFIMIPIMILVAPAIKMESKGPVFFSQMRIGKNGRRFKIYKLRSMYQDADLRKKELLDKNEMNGYMFKMRNDPRITKVGKFIRKTSIDELPQFINVIKGEMSLVGTRPPTIDEYERYETLHRRRISIKPGITGLWQISGRSTITSFSEVVKLDLEYIDHWSLGLDIKILIKTIFVVLFGRGAV